jgi:UDP-glucose 4-epimerase
MRRVLVTGASGFIGSGLVPALSASGFAVRCFSRRGRRLQDSSADGGAVWANALDGCECVVHLAGPASTTSAPTALRRAVDDAAALAAAAAQAGVERFVYVSSIKAAAARTGATPVRETDPPMPDGAYGRAKLAAEAAILSHRRLNAVVLRPPLVYDADAKSHFRWLLRLADSGAPLPFAGMRNQRSLIARSTLASAIVAALLAPGGPCGVFHIADRRAVSTGEIIALLREGMRRPPRLFNAGALSSVLPAALRESLAVDDCSFRDAYGFYGGDISEGLLACGALWKKRA